MRYVPNPCLHRGFYVIALATFSTVLLANNSSAAAPSTKPLPVLSPAVLEGQVNRYEMRGFSSGYVPPACKVSRGGPAVVDVDCWIKHYPNIANAISWQE